MGRPPGRPRKVLMEEPLQKENEAPKINTSEGGLAITQPVDVVEILSKTAPWVGVHPEESEEPEEYIEPTVNSAMNLDPMATPAATLMAVGKFYNDAGVLSVALTKHMRTTSGEPELFSFLQRLQTVIGDLRAAVEQIETGMSDHLRNSIEEAVA